MAAPAVAWFEVTGKDGASLQDFYGKLFDWKIDDAGDGTGYGLVAAAEKGIGGGIGAAQDGGSGQVTFYVEVDDVAAFLKKAEGLGGQTVVPPTEIEQFGPLAPLPPRRSPPEATGLVFERHERCDERHPGEAHHAEREQRPSAPTSTRGNRDPRSFLRRSRCNGRYRVP